MNHRDTAQVVFIILHAIVCQRALVGADSMEETVINGIVFPFCSDPIVGHYLASAFSAIKSVLYSQRYTEVELQVFDKANVSEIVEQWAISVEIDTFDLEHYIVNIQSTLAKIAKLSLKLPAESALNTRLFRICLKLHRSVKMPKQCTALLPNENKESQKLQSGDTILNSNHSPETESVPAVHSKLIKKSEISDLDFLKLNFSLNH